MAEMTRFKKRALKKVARMRRFTDPAAMVRPQVPAATAAKSVFHLSRNYFWELPWQLSISLPLAIRRNLTATIH